MPIGDHFRMSFFRHFYFSCVGFQTYRRLVDLPVRSALNYWLILTGLLTVVFIGNGLYLFEAYLPQAHQVVQAIPSLTIRSGTAFTELPQPYLVNTNHFPVIIDLEAKIAAPEKQFSHGIVMRKKEFRIWWEGSAVLTMPLTRWPDGKIDSAYLEAFHREAYRELPLLGVISWLGFFLAGILQALLFTALINMLESTMEFRLIFHQLFNIAVFALTPGAIIAATYVTAGISGVLDVRLIYLSCYCLFLVLVTSACRTRPDVKEE